MNKTAFLNALRAQLKALPKKERQQYIDYYSEMIDDRMEDGIREEEAVAALGSIQEIASQILAEAPQKPARKFRAWEVVLLILGSPIWLSLALGAAVTVMSLYIVLWSAVIALYAADLTLLAGFISGIAAGCQYAITGMAAPALLFFGAALVCGGSAVLLFFGCNKLAIWSARLGKWMLLRFTGLFRRKEEASHA